MADLPASTTAECARGRGSRSAALGSSASPESPADVDASITALLPLLDLRGLAVGLLAALCSCGGSPASDGDDSATTSATETSDETSGEDPLAPDWLASWGAAPQEPNPLTAVAIEISDQSVRQIAHVSVGGTQVRVRLANVFGESALEISEAHLARAKDGSAIEAASDRLLTVEGASSFSIPAGQSLVTDPVELEHPALGELAVSLYFAHSVMTTTLHAEANQTAWIAAAELSAAPLWPDTVATATSWFWLSGIEVMAGPEAAAVVAFGDSLTNGSGSTLDTNQRWPDRLAERLQANAATAQVAVVNAGIGGNCLLRDFVGPRGLDRFERDVLDQPGVGWTIITIGINDIGIGAIFNQDLDAEQLTAGYVELIEDAHARGLRAYAGTLLPYEGADYYTDDGELLREAVNQWIRTSGAFDAVIDFDAATRDPNAPTRLLPAYDSGDHLHPNDAGYAAMADAIDLGLFE